MWRLGVRNSGPLHRIAIILAIAGLVFPCLPARSDAEPRTDAGSATTTRLENGTPPENRNAPSPSKGAIPAEDRLAGNEAEIPASEPDNAPDETPDLDELLSWPEAVSGRREAKQGCQHISARLAHPFPPVASRRHAGDPRGILTRAGDLPIRLCRLTC